MRLKDKPFWIWNVAAHKAEDRRTKGDCCFNHIIGLPQKNGIERPLYDYQKIVLDALDQHKHVFIKKATGIGISELMLRYIAWLCLYDNSLVGSQVCIVTGPRVDLAIALIDRMKKLFESKAQIYFDSKETVLELNGVHIEAFPAHHIDSMRGLPSVKAILLDEADFFPIGQQQDARDVSERYIGKSNPYIVMVSTPNQPGGLFEQIERESADKCLYTRLYLDYTYGLDKIYSQSEILKAQASPSFAREYDLHYGGHVGNVFSESSIQAAIKKGAAQFDPRKLATAVNRFSRRVLAVDPGFGSSSCGMCIAQLVNVTEANATTTVNDAYSGNTIQILYAEEFARPDFNAMISVVTNLMQQYFIMQDEESKVYVDGSAPAFIRALKIAIGENPDYEGAIASARASGFTNLSSWAGKVEPIVFGTGGVHKAMLNHAKILMDAHCIAVHPTQTKLITALRTAYEHDGSLDKDRTSCNDVFDAFRMCLKYFEIGRGVGGTGEYYSNEGGGVWRNDY